MKIGIFSKLGSSGGSEHRAVEMANGIAQYTNHQSFILCEKDFNHRIATRVNPLVEVITNIFQGHNPNPSPLYDMDSLLVINTDSYSFSRLNYWKGKRCWEDKEPRHTFNIDLRKIPQMVFLYNFMLKPSKHLHTVQQECKDVRIVCANNDYYNEILNNNRYADIRDIPKMVLESPINPDSVSTEKKISNKIRIGRHSKAFGYKYDTENIELIERINKKYGNQIIWDFMGITSKCEEAIKNMDNVIIRKEYSTSVKDFLQNIDIMLFFIKWSREEPWARVVAEGMASGCPILATNKAGNQDQIKHGENGFLCNNLDEFEKHLSKLIKNPQKIKEMGQRSIDLSKEFTTEKTIKKYMDFIL